MCLGEVKFWGDWFINSREELFEMKGDDGFSFKGKCAGVVKLFAGEADIEESVEVVMG